MTTYVNLRIEVESLEDEAAPAEDVARCLAQHLQKVNMGLFDVDDKNSALVTGYEIADVDIEDFGDIE